MSAMLADRPRARPKRLLQGFVPERKLAHELGCSLRTLLRWRADGIGPPHIKKGRAIYYDVEVVRRWMAAGGTPKKTAT